MEEESKAKKILHKLTPGHHHKDAADKETKKEGGPLVQKPLAEQSEHIHSHASHPHIESYVGSGLHGGIKEFLQSLSEEEAIGVISNLVRVQAIVGTGAAIREGLNVLGDVAGMDVVGKLVAAQVDIITRASLSPLGRKAAREAATEAVTGSYDAVVCKFTESPALLLMGGVLGFLLFAPLVLSLWRFALFGLD